MSQLKQNKTHVDDHGRIVVKRKAIFTPFTSCPRQTASSVEHHVLVLYSHPHHADLSTTRVLEMYQSALLYPPAP